MPTSMIELNHYLPSLVSQSDAVIMIIASLATSFLTAAFGIGGGAALLALAMLTVLYGYMIKLVTIAFTED